MSPFGTGLAGPIPLNFDVVARSVVLSLESGALNCPECEAPIDLHQPDENQPATLLGTCFECSRWYLVIEVDDAYGRTVLVELPGAERIREIVEGAASNGA